MSEALLEHRIASDEESSIDLASRPGSLPLIPRILPAIARQAILKFVDPDATATTSMVVAKVLETLHFPAEIIDVEVSVDRQASLDPSSVRRDRYSCVLTGAVLIDACLDRMSAPGNRASLRPSWFEVPTDWPSCGRASFSNSQTGVIVSYQGTAVSSPEHPTSEPTAVSATGTLVASAELIERIALEVVELCQRSEQILAGLESDFRRWIPITSQ